MSLYSILQHSSVTLMISCLLWALIGGQVQQAPLNNFNQGQQLSDELKSPLIRSVLAHLENIKVTTPVPVRTSEAPVARVPFLNALLARLEERQPANATAQLPQDRLSLTLHDGPLHTVSIDFLPGNYVAEQQKGWNTLVELLADSLAFVIQEAKKQGYNSYFKYSAVLADTPSGRGGPALSGDTLKSIVG